MGNEFRVEARSLEDYAKSFPFGQIGEENPPKGMSAEEYPRTIEFRDGQRFLQFRRPFRVYPAGQNPVTLTDADNGMWVPDRLLQTADPAIAR